MSLRESEHIESVEGFGGSPWVRMLRANALVPLFFLLLVPGYFLFRPDVIGPYYQRVVMLVGVNIILAVSLQLINGISGQFSLGHAGFMAVGAYLAAYPSKIFSNDVTSPAAVLLFYVALAVVIVIAAAVLALLFAGIRKSIVLGPAVPSILFIGLMVWFLVDIALASRNNAVRSLLPFSSGIAGLTALFHGTIQTLAPAAHAVDGAIPATIAGPLCFVLLLIGGGLCAAVAGLVVGLPTLRLRGDYLAIATLGFGEIIRVAINNADALGGATGFRGMPTYTNFVWLYGAVIVTVLVVWRLAHSAQGRAMAAVREDEIASAAVGISTTRSKVFAFVVGAFLAGVAGALWAHYTTLLHPSEYGFMRSVELVVIVTLAGLGSISGAVVAAIILTILPEALREYDQYRMILYSLLLIIMMLLRPQGLLGMRELWPTRRRSRPGRKQASEAPAPAVKV
jgi:branched-chain amino acid transport system permease protein